MTEETKITAYKGFDSKLRCRGMQYKVGETAVHNGVVSVCDKGLHACEYPLDIFSYYAPGTNRFAEVTAHGTLSRRDNEDSKLACARLTVVAELKLPELVSKAVKYILGGIKSTKTESNTGDRSAATNTGYRSAATNTGNRSAAEVSGIGSIAAAIGTESKARASKGSAFILVHRNKKGEVIKVVSGIPGKKGVKANMWYTLSERGALKGCK